jgi:branched-chain amino acid transport system permease protein
MVYVLAGGNGNLRGSLLAVCVLMAVEQSITHLPGLPTSLIGPLQRILYGIVLLTVILYAPRGMLPEAPIFRRARLPRIKAATDALAFLSRGKPSL